MIFCSDCNQKLWLVPPSACCQHNFCLSRCLISFLRPIFVFLSGQQCWFVEACVSLAEQDKISREVICLSLLILFSFKEENLQKWGVEVMRLIVIPISIVPILSHFRDHELWCPSSVPECSPPLGCVQFPVVDSGLLLVARGCGAPWESLLVNFRKPSGPILVFPTNLVKRIKHLKTFALLSSYAWCTYLIAAQF